MVLFFFFSFAHAQNTAIKCYFNHPVNNIISSGANATYLNGTFPDTIAAYINKAKFTVDVAMYNFTASSFSNVYKIAVAANNAANRGVIIRWVYNASTSNTGLPLLNASIKTFASPVASNYIMHNKFLVIDANATSIADPFLITGSYNFSDEQSAGDYNNILIVQNKDVALAYYNEFNKMWGGTGANPNAGMSAFGTSKTTSARHIFDVNGSTVEVYFSPKDTTGGHLQTAINTANHDLFFGIYTFTDYTIANLIKTKYNNGIAVRGIMDQFSQTYSPYTTLNPVLGNNLIIYAASTLYHNKIMLVDALNPESDPLVFTGSFNWSGAAQTSNDENAIVVHNASIANQYYQSLCKDFTNLGGVPCVAAPCAGDTSVILSSARGNSYQWQVDLGTGFNNVPANSFYSGNTSINLILNNPPSSWYGYRFRCWVGAAAYSDTTTLKFTAYWNGTADTAWENPLNWNCGKIPDANTDVIINKGVMRFPEVNSTTACRSLRLNNGTTVNINANSNLNLTGN